MFLYKDWTNVVFFLCAGAYLPLALGGWTHPSEINVAAYSLWLILSAMLLYSSRSQGFAGWKMPLGFFIGNFSMLTLAGVRGGYTFNLGPAETMVLYGIIVTLSTWVAVGQMTGKWDSRILFIGGVAADVLSFYPQLKQYLEPHESPTELMFLGWGMWILGAIINVVFVEKLFSKLREDKVVYQQLYGKKKRLMGIVEESLFSLENGIFMMITVIVMLR